MIVYHVTVEQYDENEHEYFIIEDCGLYAQEKDAKRVQSEQEKHFKDEFESDDICAFVNIKVIK